MLSSWRTGLALGVSLGLYHLFWAILVSSGLAQLVVDFILKIHFIELPLTIAPFDPGLAALLVLMTTLVGGLTGAIFAGVWNWTHRRPT